MIDLLDKLGCICCLFDESNSFIGSLGRYSNGANYDRSLFLSLYNAPSSLDRDLKSGRTRLVEPRVNICLLGHPFQFIKMLKEERDGFDDGLIQRFLLSVPKPHYIKATQIRNAKKPKISLFSILFAIYNLYKNQVNFKPSDVSLEVFDDIYSTNQNLIEKANTCDIF